MWRSRSTCSEQAWNNRRSWVSSFLLLLSSSLWLSHDLTSQPNWKSPAIQSVSFLLVGCFFTWIGREAFELLIARSLLQARQRPSSVSLFTFKTFNSKYQRCSREENYQRKGKQLETDRVSKTTWKKTTTQIHSFNFPLCVSVNGPPSRDSRPSHPPPKRPSPSLFCFTKTSRARAV